MSTSPLSPDDIRAAAEVHAELDPEYREAVVESFLAKIDSEIAERIDAQLATTPPPRKRDTDPITAARRRGVATGLVSGLALGTIVVGVPFIWLAVDAGDSHGLLLIWAVIAIVYGAGAAAVLVRNRRRQQAAQRQQRNSALSGAARGGRATRVIPGH